MRYSQSLILIVSLAFILSACGGGGEGGSTGSDTPILTATPTIDPSVTPNPDPTDMPDPTGTPNPSSDPNPTDTPTGDPTPTATATSTPGPTATPLPPLPDAVRIELEDYDRFSDTTPGSESGLDRGDDVDVQDCEDVDCGLNVGWTEAGEWLEYDVILSAATYAAYEVHVRVASNSGGGQLSVSAGGETVSGSVPNTNGWQTWATINLGDITLDSEASTVRVDIIAAGGNLNWIEFIPKYNIPTPLPTLTARPTPAGDPVALSNLPPVPGPQADYPPPDVMATGIATDDYVTLTHGTYTFSHWNYVLDGYSLVSEGSPANIVSTTYNTLEMENNYLKVVLLPGFGGRILSIENKSTGSEQLYQNPVGVPYGRNKGYFYYDWLMVLGGIFPTFPEPEHGKTWFLEWDYGVSDNGGDIATVHMRFQDTIDFNSPGRFNNNRTDIICTYTVSLKAGRAAVDVVVTLENPTNSNQNYEYWTSTTLAPGSTPGDTRATSGLEMIADIGQLDTSGGQYGIQDPEPTNFNQIRNYTDHQEEGIAYPQGDYNASYWGAINHDNEEGIIRIADNSVTPGLKIWTWGYGRSIGVNPETDTDAARPYLEPWAGVSNKFFSDASAPLPANGYLTFDETYTATVGLSNVTHASTDVLANVTSSEIEFNFLTPDQTYTVRIEQGPSVIEEEIQPNPFSGNSISKAAGGGRLIVTDSMGDIVMQEDF